MRYCNILAAASPQTKYKTGRWDLTELASGPRDSQLTEQIKQLQKKTARFEKERKNLAPEISSRKFARLIGMIEEIVESSSKIEGFASLLHAADTQSDENTSFLLQVSKLDSDITNRILFFSLWWKNSLDAGNAERLASESGEIAEYLRHRRRLAQYTLSEPEEKIINTLDVTGASALVNLYDKITNAYQYRLRVNKRVRSMTREEISNYVRGKDSRLRKAAYVQILSKYDAEKGVIGQIYQNIVQNWTDETVKLRGYNSPISVRNIGNNLEDKTVNSLLETCKKNACLFQEFFKLKAKLLHIKQLRRYDIYAPVTRKSRKQNFKERRYAYDTAVNLILRTLTAFSPELGAFAKEIISKNHVDSSIRPGKRDGAFCSTITPNILPYILLNFTGKTKDVFTFAHEMGHAVHSQAASSKSILVQHAPLPLAETASTFSELLLYDVINERMSDYERLQILVEKIDDLYSTIMRQAFFTTFEIDAHHIISDKNGTIDDLSKTYMNNLNEQFGRSISISDDFAIEWGCIPHFYHSPFYCYAYSFGNLLSLSLFQRYKKEGSDFVPSYIDILAAGGSQKPEDLLAQYGFDITSHQFWQDGFEYVSRQIKELESVI